MKISQLEVGMSVWSVSRVNMGNTTLKTVVVHPVVIVEVHDNHVIATWNGNAPRRFGESVVKGWKKEKPLLIREGFGQMRLATREEQVAPFVTCMTRGVMAPTTWQFSQRNTLPQITLHGARQGIHDDRCHSL